LWRCTYLTSDLGNEWLLDPGIGTCCLVSFDWHQWKESIVIMDFFLLTIFNDIFIDSLINTCGRWDLSNVPPAFLIWQWQGHAVTCDWLFYGWYYSKMATKSGFCAWETSDIVHSICRRLQHILTMLFALLLHKPK
jgi:hypothetical protein